MNGPVMVFDRVDMSGEGGVDVRVEVYVAIVW